MYALIDCNNFFVSCERIFSPILKNLPVVVLSNNDGCVISRSNEAKELGIKMGEPFFQIRDRALRDRITYFSSNFELYVDISKRIMNIIKSEFQNVEVYSIDEAFLRLKKVDLIKLINIKNKIYKDLNIPISIGVGKTKTLAKIASKIAKKKSEGIFEIDEKNFDFRNLKCEAVWGIGRKLSKKLRSIGIYSVADFLLLESSSIRKNFGVNLEKTFYEILGKDCIKLEKKEHRKSIAYTRSFLTKSFKKEEVLDLLKGFLKNILKILQSERLLTSRFLVILDYRNINLKKYQNIRLENSFLPTNDYSVIINLMKNKLYKEIGDFVILNRLGIILGGLESEIEVFNFDQFNIKKEKLNSEILSLNRKFGKEILSFDFFQKNNEKNLQKKEQQSPSYTTKFSDILNIRI